MCINIPHHHYSRDSLSFTQKDFFFLHFLRRLFFIHHREHFFISTKYLPFPFRRTRKYLTRLLFYMHTKERGGNENLQKIKSPLGMCLLLMSRWQCKNFSPYTFNKCSMIMCEVLSRFIVKVGWNLLRILKPQIHSVH